MRYFKAVYYKTPASSCPVFKFLKCLNDGDRAKVYVHIEDKLEQFGNEAGRRLFEDIYELRIKAEQGEIRILYFMDDGYAVLLEGFIKKSKKTPADKIFNAINRKKEYLRNRGR